MVSCFICLLAGALAPVAFATNHGCATYWSGGDHWHEGEDNENNDCSTNGHGDSTVEYFLGYSGTDTLNGGAGIDRIKGQADYDIIYGGYGAYDVLEGGSGVVGDYIFGENDVDQIYGGENKDRLKGNEGDDFLYDDCCGNPNEEKDHACGSGGHDSIYVQDGDPEDNIYDPGGTDYISRDNENYPGGVGVDGITTSDCPF